MRSTSRRGARSRIPEPSGDLPLKDVRENYDGLISSGRAAFRNHLLYRVPLVNLLMRHRWARPSERVEGMNLPESRAVKRAVSIPVLCTGGFQTASVVRRRLPTGRATPSRSRGRLSQTRICSPSDAEAKTIRRGPARSATSASSTCSRARSAATTRGLLVEGVDAARDLRGVRAAAVHRLSGSAGADPSRPFVAAGR
jgi:hypothetical protein